MILDYFWIALAVYGIAVQGMSLHYARVNFRVARAFTDGMVVMARARLQTNWWRMSIVTLNLAIGIIALYLPVPSHPIPLSTIVALVFVANEVGMCGVATLEVRAHRRLRRSLAG